MNEHNVLVLILKYLRINYTTSYANKMFNEHPHKYNLFGLSSMLSDYGIENKGIKLMDKEDIHLIDPPFLAHTSNDFVVIEKIYNDDIRFIERGKSIKIPLVDFFKIWTGNILIVESNKASGEPDYKINRRRELFQNLRRIIILSLLFFLFFYAFILNGTYTHFGSIILLLINFIGIFLGYLLVLKQLHIQSNYADKLCSLFRYNDCNNILESPAAKFFGVLGWSEIGLGYFISNVIILCFLPYLITCLLIYNIFCLPYSFWSIWYQKFRAKQWCPLCLGVMTLLWGIFVTGLGFWDTNFSAISFWSLIITGSIYIISVLTINMVISVISRGRNVENIRYEINSIKANEDVFKALLEKQPHYEVQKETSRILWGNPNSSLLVTVFSNPHCAPCSVMHKRLNKLLQQNKDICVQYIFSSFNEELEVSNKYLIGTYFQKNGEAKEIYDYWFEKGKFNKDEFFKLYPVDIDMKNVKEEFELHKQWKEQSGLRATPTVLVNGYKLPNNIKIEDIRYFTDTRI